MYTEFFGFAEKPFKLVPNPAFLFFGRSHQEAMAHLVYALREGEGFVEITGEIGTGKTTLCRAFLENLDEQTEAAYIFNPNLDAIGLLKAVNDEFGLNSTSDKAKELVDSLNRFLMAAKAGGKTILLVIDEAQNLPRSVLEQIRLLSNLETTQNKLLQIILVGQPELRSILDSSELRQLRQRVTLSLHLEPLSADETRAYIEHRLQIAAGEKSARFHKDAMRKIYRYSQGVPRLINIACDRALLTAYGLNHREISGKTARKAIGELRGQQWPQGAANRWQRGTVLGLVAAGLIIALLLFTAIVLDESLLRQVSARLMGTDTEDVAASREETRPKTFDRKTVKPEKPASRTVAANLPVKGKPDKPVRLEEPGENGTFLLGEVLGNQQFSLSRMEAFQTILALWDLKPAIMDTTVQVKDDDRFFNLTARQSGLKLYRVAKDLDLLTKLNLPAIMRFRDPETGKARFLVLSGLEKKAYLFTCNSDTQKGLVRADRSDVARYWGQEAFVPWKNVFFIEGEIPSDSPSESLITLKLLLRDIGYRNIDLSPRYDAVTRQAVMNVQRRYHLPVDGVVGSLTKIALYNAKGDLGFPSLK